MMRKSLLVICVTILGITACHTSNQVSLVVLQTTDLHGCFGTEMSALSGYIKTMQHTYGDRLILLDGGDNLQGTPQVFFANYIDTTSEHIYSRLFNWLSYDVITPGNHDLEVGKKVFEKVYKQMKKPVVCANIIRDETGEPYFKPYTVLRRQGVKIAVLGLLTPQATEWFPENIRGDLTVSNPEDAAEHWVRIIQEREKPDVLIGLFHSGWGNVSDRDTSESAPAIGAWIAHHISGFHLVCCGHVHLAKTGFLVNKVGDTVHMVNAGANASHISQIHIDVMKNKTGKANVQIKTQVVPSREFPVYAPYEKIIKPFLDREQAYNTEECCILLESVYSRHSMFGSSAWIDEQHRVQLAAANSGTAAVTGAVISFASPAARNLVLEAGKLQIKDFITALPYENTLSVVRMNGKEIIKYLEYAYALRIDNPEGPAYNFDSAAGIFYRVYRCNPAGERIRILSMADGSPFDSEEDYHVVMNTFRARGGGGHLTKGVGLSMEDLSNRLLWVSETDIRTLYRQTMAMKGEVRLTPLHHWRYL